MFEMLERQIGVADLHGALRLSQGAFKLLAGRAGSHEQHENADDCQCDPSPARVGRRRVR